MPKLDRHLKFILIGFVGVVMGAVVPFLMVLQLMESTFFWNFFAYVASVGGLFLGIIGAAELAMDKYHKSKKDDEDHRR